METSGFGDGLPHIDAMHTANQGLPHGHHILSPVTSHDFNSRPAFKLLRIEEVYTSVTEISNTPIKQSLVYLRVDAHIRYISLSTLQRALLLPLRTQYSSVTLNLPLRPR